MKRNLFFVFAILLCFSVSLMAQEEKKAEKMKDKMAKEATAKEKMAKDEMQGKMQDKMKDKMPAEKMEKSAGQEMDHMMPPKKLDDEFLMWMLGEWEGSSTSAQGKTQEWESNEIALDGQYVISRSKSKMDNDMVYKGMGSLSVNPENGQYFGVWMDNWRGMYHGSGAAAEGNKSTMEWKGPHGTYTRTIEKVDENTYKGTWKFVDPAGESHEGTMEMTRKQMTDKS